MKFGKKMAKKKFLIKSFNKLSRLITVFTPFVLLYDWPNRKFIWSQKIEYDELSKFLKELWPKIVSGNLLRFGTAGDGGYLLPSMMQNIKVCYSGGVETNSDFEADIVSKFGCLVYMLDGSVSGPPITSPNFKFKKLWVGNINTSDTIDVNDWLKLERNTGKNEVLLKLDIEGHEYNVLQAISDLNWEMIGCLVCEFHAFEVILSGNNKRVRGIFEMILSKFDCVHVHANNSKQPYIAHGFLIPSDIEITFVKKDFISVNGKVNTLPHDLDVSCTSNPEVNLNWYTTTD